MARLAVEATTSTATTYITSYDSTKWNMGDLIRKRTDLSPNFIAPIASSVFRPVEQSAAIPGIMPNIVRWSNTLDWVFLADNATVATTRRIQAYTFSRDTGTFTWLGYITLTYSTATNHQIRAMRVTYDKYSVGSASASGTAVTGTSSLWVTNRMCSGCRIGFGSTDPTQITTWYEISAIGSETGITLTGSAGTVSDGPYVIEDLRIITANSNATATNGGVYLTKGIGIHIFQSGGTTVAAAVGTDLVRAVYWLADASTETNAVMCGADVDAKVDWLNQYCYTLDLPSAGNYHIYQYNIRKALTLASGKDYTTLVMQTGNNAVTGTGSQNANLILRTLGHGSASGVKALYYVTTTRVYATRLSTLSPGSTTFAEFVGTEIPPGSVNTFAAQGTLTSIDYAETLDRLIITTTGTRAYITQFRTDASQFDHIIFVDDKQIDQSSEDAGTAIHPTTLSVWQSTGSVGGLLYTTGLGTTVQTNIGHVIPIGADWQYSSTTNQKLISPSISTPNCNKYNRFYCIHDRIIGSDNLGLSSEAYRVSYRTSGISDNSGSWNVINDYSDISGVAGASAIQFCIEYKVISDTCIPHRVVAIGCTYDDLSTDAHYQPSVANSNINTKKFAWRFCTAFGSSVPALRVRLYDATTASLLVDDNTTLPTGTFEMATDGSTFISWTNADKGNETTYIRYTAAVLGDGIKIRALLTLL